MRKKRIVLLVLCTVIAHIVAVGQSAGASEKQTRTSPKVDVKSEVNATHSEVVVPQSKTIGENIGMKSNPKSAFKLVQYKLVTNNQRALDKFRVETTRNQGNISSIEFSNDFSTVTIKCKTELGEPELKSILSEQGILVERMEIESEN
jgi:ABC-type oligopeptide transport system substrate-binding subunit